MIIRTPFARFFGDRLHHLPRAITAPQLFVASFIGLILIGTLGFMILPGLYTGRGLTFLEALFTSTSAVCVTGLIVVDTATFFTTAGQAYILLLIQLGGLGIITFTSLILMALGMRMSLRHESLSRTHADIAPHVDYRILVRDVFLFTFVIEAIGAILLYASWMPFLGVGGSIWPAIFHSVSAFCNAGFSTFSDSLVGYQKMPITIAVIMGLIILGGIGFLTLEELRVQLGGDGKRGIRLSLHTRLVLATSAVLIVGGWALFSVFEWSVSFGHMNAAEKLWNGLFMSVTARTAGFNTVDYQFATDGSNFLTILLMSIGGSPGSTAGGLKTTTIAILGLLAWSRMKGYTVTSVWGRSVPEETVQRAVGLFVIAFGVVTAAIFLFTVSQISWVAHAEATETFLTYMFEAVSAFNTVGLSMGATGDLSSSGRVLTIILMFIGRVGTLTFAAALARRHAKAAGAFYYAYEDVAIG